MTAPSSDSDATRYVSTVLTLYLGLPETPLRPSPKIAGVPTSSMIAMCPCLSSSQLSCWLLCVAYSGQLTYHPCLPFDPWPTFNP